MEKDFDEIDMPSEGSEEEMKKKEEEENVWSQLDEELEMEKGKRPPIWQPDIGDKLFGTVRSTGKSTRTENRFLEIEIAKNPVKAENRKNKKTTVKKGEKVLVWEKAALSDLFDETKAGDKIALQFLGQKESDTPSKRSYQTFNTALRKK
ncbi:MAG: hypothetical protein BTN85_1996 [Candidatus Methanohalarchaeum thermophilum]|uniref:Uncharacterized protein n=1 Tax=Methanohalarchaeum thermophilum TaxID=1903181 RepID=A0A1Q6DSJ9_METT1|nr:MAG: hypothetical protein BTN85_1996 [Candidatus Methanohalarchaeum thermophilum]